MSTSGSTIKKRRLDFYNNCNAKLLQEKLLTFEKSTCYFSKAEEFKKEEMRFFLKKYY